jgi:hypothetical protein
MKVYLLSLSVIGIFCGCDHTGPSEVVVTPIPPQRSSEAYAMCPQTDAQYKLEFTVRDSYGESYEDTFFLCVTTIHGERYPYHGGSISSADGADGGFNKSCHVENGTETGVAIRFRLASRRDGHPDLNLNELVWGTVGRRTSVELPQDCQATFDFVSLESGQSAGNNAMHDESPSQVD